MTNLRKEIEEILVELTKKRGKHSLLWMWPKTESLNQATDELISLFRKYALSCVPKKKKVKFNTDIGFNSAISKTKQAIKEKGR